MITRKENDMKAYIGTKIIKATPMTRGEYNNYRGWDIPENENPEDEGYLVEYSDGYQSWSPEKQFEEAYRECDKMTFGLALEALKKGKKVAREGWNGKGMYLYLVHGRLVDVDMLQLEAYDALAKDEGAMHDTGVVQFLSHIDMRTANGDVCVGWLASQTDMLAEDWKIVE